MGRLRRIDAELVRRGLAPNRDQAKVLVEQGLVKVDGGVVTKPARQVDPSCAIVVAESGRDTWVSRGAYKLLGALDQLGDNAPLVSGRVCLDAGASTGGFTDVLLRRGAAAVIAVDVGYGQLAWRLREDDRVIVLERTNVRTLAPSDLPDAPQVIVGDLSFISLKLVLPALTTVAAPGADLLLMVKPQFEIGKDRLGSGGVVRNPDHHIETVTAVAGAAKELGLSIHAVTPSPLPGPAGNVEYFLHMRKPLNNNDEPGFSDEALSSAIATAVEQRPIPGDSGTVASEEAQ